MYTTYYNVETRTPHIHPASHSTVTQTAVSILTHTLPTLIFRQCSIQSSRTSPQCRPSLLPPPHSAVSRFSFVSEARRTGWTRNRAEGYNYFADYPLTCKFIHRLQPSLPLFTLRAQNFSPFLFTDSRPLSNSTPWRRRRA